jgi:hypothetical protein
VDDGKGKRRRKKDKLHVDEVGYDGGGVTVLEVRGLHMMK